ncbi:unnamed protein product [Urochloa decumbens]|uniref:Uncharacterized protein n=1 Tax=Urochloa decumbens TaxID=240449 RepID=A0ABC8VHG9_9POAL
MAALGRFATGTWGPAASALRCTVSSHHPQSVRRFSHDVEYARDLLKRVKKEEEVARGIVKWVSRGVKALEWTCYFGVSVTAATFVMMGKP